MPNLDYELNKSHQYFCGNPLQRSSSFHFSDDFLLECLTENECKIMILIGKDTKKIVCLEQCSSGKLDGGKCQPLYLNIADTLITTKTIKVSEWLDIFDVVLLGCVNAQLPLNSRVWYVALSLSDSFKEDEVLQNSAIVHISQSAGGTPKLLDVRSMLFSQTSVDDLAISGLALALCVWHNNNRYSGLTGEKTESIECGMKRCVMKSGETVISKVYPRVDPVMIACVISPCKTKALLGKMRRMPNNFYSCLSGFIEPCESIQEAVRREVWEESGVHVGAVEIIDSQPWPLGRGGGCELMIGCIAFAETYEIVITEEEVEDVRWFDLETLKAMVEDSVEMKGFRGRASPFIPGPYAIAHHLIKHFVNMFRIGIPELKIDESDDCNVNSPKSTEILLEENQEAHSQQLYWLRDTVGIEVRTKGIHVPYMETSEATSHNTCICCSSSAGETMAVRCVTCKVSLCCNAANPEESCWYKFHYQSNFLQGEA